MKNKGFTLIELLAVIVILAIIALIATPIILNVIDTARKGAKESSALGYFDAVEKQVMMSQVDSTATKIEPGTYTVAQLEALGVKIKGEAPKNDSVITIGDKGQVTNAWVTYEESEYKIYYDGSKAVADTTDYVDSKGVKHNEIASSGKSYSVGESVYLDPTDLTKTCDASNSVSTTGTKTGCMKWYVIKDNGSSINILLDHNTTALVEWVSKTDYNDDTNYNGSNGNNNKGPITANKQLTTDTVGWKNELNPRLITANEVVEITNTTTFDGSSNTNFYLDGTGDKKQTQVSTSQGQSSYAWLFDYTSGCTSHGCNINDSSTDGYWTSSPVTDFSFYAWVVFSEGSLDFSFVSNDDIYGIRPVITVQKSVLN